MDDKKPYNVGYTTGVFDLFHIGHLILLRNAKSLCDHLIVGVSTDELVIDYKNKKPVIPFKDRLEIVGAIKYVDTVVPQYDMNKRRAVENLKANVVFVGGWQGSPEWNEYERQLKEIGVPVIYFPYNKGISSTLINSILDEKRQEMKEKEKKKGGLEEKSSEPDKMVP